jgi:hypothetical protein
LSEGLQRSRRLHGSVLSLIGLLLVASAPLASGRDSKPRIVITETSYDFGDVFAGQYMYHVFPIRNEGTLPLTMSDELPGKPAVKPSSPAYTHPNQNTDPSLDVLTLGEAFGVVRYAASRPGATFDARGAYVAARHTTGETSLASATPASFAANPSLSGEPVPT